MIRQIKWIIILFFLFGGNTTSYSQNSDIVTLLLDTANSDTVFFLKRVKFAEQALSYAKLSGNKRNLFEANISLGEIYLRNNTYDKALVYLKTAQSIANTLKLKKEIIEVDYLLGRLYMNILNFENTIKQFRKTIEEAKEIADSSTMGDAYSSLGITYSKQGKIDSSMIFYQKALQIFDKIHQNKKKQPTYINIGDYFLEIKQPDSALYYFNLSLQIDSIYQTRAIAIIYINIGLAYSQKNDFKKAIKYYRRSLKIARNYSYRYVIYANYLEVSRIYEKSRKPDSALFYFKQYAALKDSIFNADVLDKINKYQTFVELEKKDKEITLAKSQVEIIKQKERVARFKNYLLLFFGLFSVLLGLILFWRQRSINRSKENIMKKNRELQLIKIEMANREIESKNVENKRLSEELEKKKKDLLNFGLDISRKNKFFQVLKVEIKKAMNAKEQEQQASLKQLYFLLQNHIRINDDLSIFQQNIENVNQKFITKLSQEFPNLTQLEISLCGMIKIGLSIKEISAIRNVSPKSVEMSRYRLRKKIDLPKNVDLTRFLNEY